MGVALRRYTADILSETTGLALTGATLQVVQPGTSTRVPVYVANDAGGATVAQPIPNGTAFYVPDGRYDLLATGPRGTKRIPQVDLFDGFEQNRRLEAVENGEPGAPGSLRADLLASTGSGRVSFETEGSGTRKRDVASKLGDVISVKDFGAIGDDMLHTVQEWIIPGALGPYASLAAVQVDYPHVTSVNDSIDWAAIQAAFAHAGGLSITEVPIDSYAFAIKGGAEVLIPAGSYWLGTSPTLEMPQNVSMRGVGNHSSILRSEYNGPILRNDATTAAGTGSYNREGTTLRDFGIIGNPAKPLQDGLSLLRWVSGVIENVHVSKCGRDGVVFREGVCGIINNLMVSLNKGTGLRIRRGVADAWESADGPYPSNGLTFNGFRAIANDGFGILLEDYANGIVFNEPFVEYNNGGGTVNDGCQIVVQTGTYCPIIFNRLWSEGDHLAAHVYVNNSGAQVALIGWRHFSHGDLVDRALIATAGSVRVKEAWGASNSYPTINGSNAPYRIAAGAVSIDVVDDAGASVTGLGKVEKMDGSRVALENELWMFGRDGSYGNFKHYSASGAVSVMEFFRDDEQSVPWLRLEPFYRAIALADVMLKRTGTRTLGLDTRGGAQFFDQGSTWNGNHGLMGNYHLWVDATGALRMKNGAPTGDTDGAVVGTQVSA